MFVDACTRRGHPDAVPVRRRAASPFRDGTSVATGSGVLGEVISVDFSYNCSASLCKSAGWRHAPAIAICAAYCREYVAGDARLYRVSTSPGSSAPEALASGVGRSVL